MNLSDFHQKVSNTYNSTVWNNKYAAVIGDGEYLIGYAICKVYGKHLKLFNALVTLINIFGSYRQFQILPTLHRFMQYLLLNIDTHYTLVFLYCISVADPGGGQLTHSFFSRNYVAPIVFERIIIYFRFIYEYVKTPF